MTHEAEAPKEAPVYNERYKTAIEWKSIKHTPDTEFRKMLADNNWSDVQRLSEEEYDKGASGQSETGSGSAGPRIPDEDEHEHRRRSPHR